MHLPLISRRVALKTSAEAAAGYVLGPSLLPDAAMRRRSEQYWDSLT
jgi:hypothetical protein